MAAQDLRRDGNDLYCRGRYLQAVEKYDAYIECVLREKSGYEKLVAGYSNRAQAHLQLHKYTKALEDVEKALSLDPTHLKSLMRKARALEGLKLYQETVSIYRALLQNFKDELHATHVKDFEQCLKEADRKDKMSRLGRYEEFIDTYWDPETPLGPLLMEEYVGPVELRRVPEMDRGLFATKDLEPGELLFVSNSMMTVRVRIESGNLQICSESKTRAIQSLFDTLSDRIRYAFDNLQDFSQFQLLVQLYALAGPYPTAPLMKDCPPMRYFTPVNALPPNQRKFIGQDCQHPAIKPTDFDYDMIMRVLERRQFTHWGNDNDELTGIYCLPTLMNHSCTPNVIVATMQNETVTKLYRAGKKIKKGDELFYAYHNIFCPLDVRRSFYPDLCCRCERCRLEESLLAEAPNLKSLAMQCTKFWQERFSFIRLSQEERSKKRKQCIICIQLLEGFLMNDPKLAPLKQFEKECVRASFIRLHRLLLDPALALKVGCTEDDVLEELNMITGAVKAMHAVQPGSDLALAMISAEYGRMTNMQFPKEFQFDGLSNLYIRGLEIARLINGPTLKHQTILKLFNYTSLLLSGHH